METCGILLNPFINKTTNMRITVAFLGLLIGLFAQAWAKSPIKSPKNATVILILVVLLMNGFNKIPQVSI